METVSVAFSKPKLLKILLLSLAFGAIGVWLLYFDISLMRYFPKYDTPMSKKIVGYGGIVIAMAGIYTVSRCLLSKKPGLLIDENGIDDNSSAFPKGFISWDDIDGVEERKIQLPFFLSQKCVGIVMKDGKPKLLSSGGLAVSTDELYRKIGDGFTSRQGKVKK